MYQDNAPRRLSRKTAIMEGKKGNYLPRNIYDSLELLEVWVTEYVYMFIFMSWLAVTSRQAVIWVFGEKVEPEVPLLELFHLVLLLLYILVILGPTRQNACF
jgi:hypothetical protein